jgi:hypothetical protein
MLGMQLDRFETLAFGALAISVAAGVGLGVALLLGASGNPPSGGRVAARSAAHQIVRVDATTALARHARVVQQRIRTQSERLAQAARDRARSIRLDRLRRARLVAAARRKAATSRRRARSDTPSRPAVGTRPPRRVVVAPPPPPPPVAPTAKPEPKARFTFDSSE